MAYGQAFACPQKYVKLYECECVDIYVWMCVITLNSQKLKQYLKIASFSMLMP